MLGLAWLLRSSELGASRTEIVTVPAGGEKAVKIALGKGQLIVAVRPWATVLVEGKERGTTPMQPLELYEGSYRVELVHEDQRWSTRATIKPGAQARIEHQFDRGSP